MGTGRSFHARRLGLAAALVATIACVPIEPPPPEAPAEGPGVGATAFSPSEVLSVVGRIDRTNGIPFTPFPLVKPFGMNVVTMLNGYMVGVFAPDSGGGPGGFAIFDIGDPRRPVLVRRVYDPYDTTSRFREPHSLPAARIGDRQVLAVPVTDGIELWDFTDVRDPRPLSHLQLYGVASGDYVDAAWQLSWQAPYLYVAGTNHGIFIVDTSDPTRPRLADRGEGRPNPVPTSELGGFPIGPVFAFGNQLVASSMNNRSGFSNLDLSDPANPTLVARTTSPVDFYASCFDGTTVFLEADGDASVKAYDLAAPRGAGSGSIAPLGSVGGIAGGKYCTRKDELLLSGNGEDVALIDAADPARMTVVGRAELGVENPDNGQVTPLGNLVYVGNDHGTGNGLVALADAPDRRAPELHASAPRDGETGVAAGSSIGLSFTDNIDLASLDADAITLSPLGGPPVPLQASSWIGMVGLTPAAPLRPDTTYELRIDAGGVRDVAGNEFGPTRTIRFSTGTELVAPLSLTAPRTSVAGEEVEFAAEGGAPPYRWEFDDGSAPTTTDAPTIRHRFPTPGHRQVLVRASDPATGGPAFGSVRVTTLRSRRWAADPVASGPVAVTDGLVVVANADSRTVSAIDLATGVKRWETEVGDRPRTVTVDRGGHIWVAVQGDDAVVALDPDGSIRRRVSLRSGAAPYGVAASPTDDRVVAAGEGDGRLRTVDTATGDVVDEVDVGPHARGVAVSGDGGHVIVTRFRPSGSTGPTPEPGRLHGVALGSDGTLGAPQAIDLPIDTTTLDGEDRARGVANYLEQVVPTPDGAELWVASKKDNVVGGRHRDGTDLGPETTVRSLVTRLAADPGAAVVGTIDVNDRSAARAVAFTPDGGYAFVAHMESNRISIVDGFTGQPVGAITDVGTAPIGLALDAASGRLAVADLLDRTVSIYDVTGVLDGSRFSPPLLRRTGTVARELLSPTELTGKRVFYDAADARMGSNGYMSCASCHQDGDTDGQVWDFTQRGEGLRSTPWLFGLSGTGGNRFHFSANFDEIQDFEHDIRAHFGGQGFLDDEAFAEVDDPLGTPKAGRSPELDALAAYVRSLRDVPRSPARTATGALDTQAARGREVFDGASCASCHSGAAFTDGQRHDVGTVDASSGRFAGQATGAVDTPSLLGVGATAPYLHNGSAPTLSALLRRDHGGAAGLSEADLAALVRYLESIDGRP